MPRSKRARSYTSRAPTAKRTYYPKRTPNYAVRISRPFTRVDRRIHYFKRSLGVTLLPGSANNVYAGITFQLSSLPNHSEFTALFDQFRITYVQLQFYLQYNPAQIDTTDVRGQGLATYPCMYITKDNDDGNSPTTLDELRQHADVKMFMLKPDTIRKYGLKPATLSAQYQSSVATSYSPTWGQWIDCANSATPYYGVKIGIENMTSSSQYLVCRATYWFQCRDTR